MKLLFNFICLIALCGFSIQELKETLDNPQKLFQNTEKEQAELSKINSKEYGTELYNKFGVKKTLQIPTNCNDFTGSFKSVNGNIYFANKKVGNYNTADIMAIAGGCATCEHYSLEDKFKQEVAIEMAIKSYQLERNKNAWVIQAKKSIPNADNILVFASVMAPGYPTQRIGGSLSDLIYAYAKINDSMSSFNLNKNRLQINNLNGTSTIYFSENVKNVWAVKAVKAPDGTYFDDMAYMGMLLEPLLPTEAKLDFQRRITKMATTKSSTSNNTSAPKVIEL